MPNEEVKAEGFDRVFKLVGGGGMYQWLLLAVVSLQGITLAFHHVGYVFLGAVPEHWCSIEELRNSSWTNDEVKNLSIPKITTLDGISKYDRCTYYDLDYSKLLSYKSMEEAMASVNYSELNVKKCSKWNYDQSIYEATTVTQFDLVCDRRYLVATIQATYMGGIVPGSVLMGVLSDKFLGRRNAVLISISICIVSGFSAALAKSYAAFVFFRFFIALGVTGSFQNTFSLVTEYCSPEKRAFFGLFSQVPFGIGYTVMPLYAYFIRDWANLQLAFSFSTLVLISYFWLLPSSPRWLAQKGKLEEAYNILCTIAKLNGKPKPHRLEIMVILESIKDDDDSNKTETERLSFIRTLLSAFKSMGQNYVNLVRTPALRKRSFLIWTLFVSVTLVYYGLAFDSALLTHDPFLLVFLGGLMEILGCTMVIPFASRWGRTPTVATTFLITGFACIGVAATPARFGAFRVILAMTGKLCIAGCFVVIYLLGAELYPTSARATGLGCAVLMGRIGSIMAPYLVDLTKHVYNDFPSITFGITAVVAGLITLFLPETKDSELLDNITSVEEHAKIIEGNDQVMTQIVRRLSQPHVDGSERRHSTVMQKQSSRL